MTKRFWIGWMVLMVAGGCNAQNKLPKAAPKAATVKKPACTYKGLIRRSNSWGMAQETELDSNMQFTSEGGSSGYWEPEHVGSFRCVNGVEIHDKEDEAKIAAEEKAEADKQKKIQDHKDALISDMRTMVVFDAEFFEVVKMGTSLFGEAGYPQSCSGDQCMENAQRQQQASLQAQFDELIAQQFRLRAIVACGGKKECAQ